jgi:hypothetical protein
MLREEHAAAIRAAISSHSIYVQTRMGTYLLFVCIRLPLCDFVDEKGLFFYDSIACVDLEIVKLHRDRAGLHAFFLAAGL